MEQETDPAAAGPEGPLPFDQLALDQLAERGATYAVGAPNVSVYGVGQVAGYLRELLDTDPFLRDLWVSGEVTNLSRSQAGHVYFTLSDANGALRCAFFRQHNAGVQVEAGESVLAHGRVSLYGERGDLQFYVDALQPEGAGILQAEFQRLFKRLEADGLFEAARKRPLPRYPRTVGVVTSPTGAVWHDIQTVLARRWPMAGLLLAPAQVQGDAAPRSIARAIEELNAVARDYDGVELDVIIVARGGGSAEDLWAFNDERVARAIFGSAVPVVSAVGHETDYTIADYVADVRAPTPSAAAELVAPEQGEERARVRGLRLTCGHALAGMAEREARRLGTLVDRLGRRAPDVDPERLRLDRLLREVDALVTQRVRGDRALLDASLARLGTLNPHATLARGYAIVQDASGRAVDGIGALHQGDAVRVQFHDGVADADVTHVERTG